MPILDPWQYWTPEAIATAIKCPVASIQANWPRLVEQLEHCHLTDKATWIAMLATVSLESARRFEPIHEFKNADGSIPDYWYTYDGGPEFHGRGFIQNTHRYNYAALGPRIAELWGAGPADFDFVTRPDDLLDPDVSAACAALYFRDHGREDGVGIPEAAAEGNWREVRRLVQGGSAGLDILIAYATALGGAMQPPVDESNAYGPNVPDSVVLQQNNWSCAVRSTYAALWSMAQVGQGEAVTYGDDGPRDVYNWMVPAYDAPNIGLLDHTGAGIARMLRDHGYAAEHIYPATLAQAKDRAGRQPLLIGGDAWNHWAMVRGKTTDGGLIVENPSPGHMGITDYLRDSWDRIGPMALVWISPASVPVQPSYEQLANLEGVAYHDDGVVIPALAAARISNDWSQVDAVIEFLRANDPHRTG
jgi:predicted chitinase